LINFLKFGILLPNHHNFPPTSLLNSPRDRCG
jgi:hypothetical protein